MNTLRIVRKPRSLQNFSLTLLSLSKACGSGHRQGNGDVSKSAKWLIRCRNSRVKDSPLACRSGVNFLRVLGGERQARGEREKTNTCMHTLVQAVLAFKYEPGYWLLYIT